MALLPPRARSPLSPRSTPSRRESFSFGPVYLPIVRRRSLPDRANSRFVRQRHGRSASTRRRTASYSRYMESLKGRLLVAAPSLFDFFRRTVVLVVEHTDQGAFGVILNRRADTEVAELVPDLGPLVEQGLRSGSVARSVPTRSSCSGISTIRTSRPGWSRAASGWLTRTVMPTSPGPVSSSDTPAGGRDSSKVKSSAIPGSFPTSIPMMSSRKAISGPRSFAGRGRTGDPRHDAG